MTHVLISVGALAALFALYGLLKPKPACGSNCGLCKHPCQTRSANHDSA